MSNVATEERIKEAVRETYGGIARRYVDESEVGKKAARMSCCDPAPALADSATQTSCCGGPTEAAAGASAQTSCCGPEQVALDESAAERFYSTEELAGLPETVTEASLGCGNPIAIAGLQPGEVVLDLGSGGGIDCFLAARKVGPEGRVIGLDMTTDMIKLARRNAKKVGLTNVDFRYGEMEEMPLPDASVDVIISNCVVNLSPDKDAVFREAYRVLRPGGRLSISDMVVDGQLPQPIRDSLNAWAGCIAGALDEADYLGKIRAAGFEQLEVVSRDYADVDDTLEWEDVQIIAASPEGQNAKALLAESDLAPKDLVHTVASIKVTAYKPE